MWERCLQPTMHKLRRDSWFLILYNMIFNIGCQIKGLDAFPNSLSGSLFIIILERYKFFPNCLKGILSIQFVTCILNIYQINRLDQNNFLCLI